MIQQHLFQPSWDYCNNNIGSPLDMDVILGDCEFSSSYTNTEDSSDVSSVLHFPTTNIDDLLPFHDFIDDLSFMFPSPDSEDLDHVSNEQVLTDEIENVFDWMQGMEDSLPSQPQFNVGGYELGISSSMEASPSLVSVQSSLVLPTDGMQVDNHLSIPCLVKSYGEAVENEQPELAEVIIRHLKESVSPIGSTAERAAYYFCQALDKQDDYLMQESSKSYGAAFRAFYEILPFGRFAHLTANMAILESIPLDAEAVHIIDFDMGDGVQWPPLMEAIGQGGRAVRLTSISCNWDSPQWSFQETKRRLSNHGQSLGIKLKIDEMDMVELANMKTTHTRKEWLVFNCMVGLPHMGREKSKRRVTEFLNIAKEVIYCNGGNSSKGVITLGRGDVVEDRLSNCWGFESILEEYLAHFHALLQSMEWHIPCHLAEARIAMECLFVAPYISSLHGFGMLERIQKGGAGVTSGMEGWRFSRENLLQAQEIVREGHNNMYSITIEGANENVMSLKWRDSPLVKVSTWR